MLENMLTAELNQNVVPAQNPARERLAKFVQNSRAANSWKAYRSDWADFIAWCGNEGRIPLPADEETVALYL